jgi:hypothetical protein
VNVAAEYELGRGGPAGTGLVVTARVENLMNDDAREISGGKVTIKTGTGGGKVTVKGGTTHR